MTIKPLMMAPIMVGCFALAIVFPDYGAPALLSGFLSFCLVGILRHQFRSYLLDIPNQRSAHTVPTPRGGGLGFLLGTVIGSALLGLIAPSSKLFLGLPLAMVLLPLALVGYFDDRHSLPATWRYGVQVLSATLAVTLFGPFPQPWLMPWGPVGAFIAVWLTIIGFTALVNLTNFMDGLDGLVGGVSLVQFTFLSIYLQQPFWLLLAAALGGFLWWNWPPAKIFMGDVGSTTLGGALALALMAAPSQNWTLLALTLPITGDAIYTLCRRLLRHENLFKAHRSHIYQRLHQQGLSSTTITLAYMGLTVLITLAITDLGALGAWLSLGLTLGLIALAEGYLRSQA